MYVCIRLLPHTLKIHYNFTCQSYLNKAGGEKKEGEKERGREKVLDRKVDARP